MKMLNVAKLSRIFERATFYKRHPIDLEGLAADRNTWRQMCQDGTKALGEDRTASRQERQERRHKRKTTKVPLRMSHRRQDLCIQDRTIQPPENSPLKVRSGRHHRPQWTTTSKKASVCVFACWVRTIEEF